MSYATLLFPTYETAVAAAKMLGFWQDPEPIYEMVPDPNQEPNIRAYYRDEDTGKEEMYPFLWPEAEATEMGLELLRTEQVGAPNLVPVQVGMTEGRLRTQGQTTRPDGTAFSWAIDEIGMDPVVVPGEYDEEGNELVPPKRLSGYAVNACGELPPEAMAYAIPYGAAGRVFSGTGPEPFTLEPAGEGYVRAVAVDPEP